MFCDCDCVAFCVGEKISCEMGLLALNLSRLCSVRTESSHLCSRLAGVLETGL